MLYFAYDASVNGDWVSHYALRLATHHPSRQLSLVYVDDGRVPRSEVNHRIEHICSEANRSGVKLSVEARAATQGVFASLAAFIPAGHETFLVCGARASERGRGFLAGTVGERFLKMGGRQVLALRVVQPGLLGVPRRLLVPVTGQTSFRSGLPLLKLLLPDLTHIHLLHVELVSSMRMRRLTHEQAVHLRRPGVGLCAEMERELTDALGDSTVMVDTHVVVSDDVAKEIIIHAGKLNSRLIYTAASERSLTRSVVAGNPLEQLLRDAPCDVAIYRGLP